MTLTDILAQADRLKAELDRYRQRMGGKVAHAFELEYTYESNRIEGNTLTLQETVLVVEKGLTIGGKPLADHLEAINHTHALEYVKEIATGREPFTEAVLLNIHRLILQSIDNAHAGRYRSVPVLISGAAHVPPQPYLLTKQMEDYFLWEAENRTALHPVLRAAELHERLVTIHPFIDGNGRTARLVMNLILLQHGYPIAILKGDAESRLAYYAALEAAQVEGDKTPFLELIADNVKSTLERVLKVVA